MDSWLKMLSPIMSFRFPASGDMWMDYRPQTNWGKISARAGSPQIEDEIFRDVALPGKQLGRLVDAVDALIEIVKTQDKGQYEEHQKPLDRISEMKSDIDRKKTDLQQTFKAEARRILEMLASADPDAFKNLVDEFSQDDD